MKKMVALALALMMLVCGTAVTAEGIDFGVMTAEELLEVIDQARLALTKYLPAVEKGSVLYEDEGIRITFTDSIEIDKYGDLQIGIIIENLSDYNLAVALANASCNGWAIDGDTVKVPAKKKTKAVFEFSDVVEDTDITKGEDVQDIEADLRYYDTDTYDNVIEPVHVTWIFGE